MSTNKVICNITEGPSRSTLIDAFKYALNVDVKMPVKFTCTSDVFTSIYTAQVIGLEYKTDRSDSIFKITGWTGLMGGVPAPFAAVYDARKQKGTLVHRGGHPVCMNDLLDTEEA